MKKIYLYFILSILIIFIGCQKIESDPNNSIAKKKSNYVILNIEGHEYGKFGIKDGVQLLNADGNKTDATITLGTTGFDVSVTDGDVTANRGIIFYMFLKNATGLGTFSFDGSTIRGNGYNGSGTTLNYRTDTGDINFFFYDSGEGINRTLTSSGGCNKKESGVLGKTVVEVTQTSRIF